MKKAKEFVAQVIQAGAKWTDLEFDADVNSLVKPGDNPLNTQGIEWKRAS